MLYHSPSQAGDHLESPVVAIGNFDGVHRGHQAVIEQLVEIAGQRDVDAAVLTFEPHPVRFFRPDIPEFRLTTLSQKAELLTQLGVDGVVAARFDEALSNLTPRQFVQRILHDGLHASCVLVGEDFQFGKRRAGDIETLRKLGEEFEIDVVAVEQVKDDGDAISSTRIRAALREADFAAMRELLGRAFAIRGTVIKGDQKGRAYGFPTANIESPNPLLPPDGIYATRLRDEEYGVLDAATYVGTRPTVGGTTRNVEAFCLDVTGDLDLYGHEVSLEFVVRVRPDRHFDSLDRMIEQMHRDVTQVREELES